MKRLVFLVSCGLSLLLLACNRQVVEPTPPVNETPDPISAEVDLDLSGTAWGYFGGGNLMGAYLSPTFAEIASGSIDPANGTFNLSLPSVVTDAKLSSSQQVFCHKGSVTTSEASWHVGYIEDFLAGGNGGDFYALMSIGNFRADDAEPERGRWYYSKTPLQVTGTCKGFDAYTTVHYDLNLKAGWNYVLKGSAGSDTRDIQITISSVETFPEKFIWAFISNV